MKSLNFTFFQILNCINFLFQLLFFIQYPETKKHRKLIRTFDTKGWNVQQKLLDSSTNESETNEILWNISWFMHALFYKVGLNYLSKTILEDPHGGHSPCWSRPISEQLALILNQLTNQIRFFSLNQLFLKLFSEKGLKNQKYFFVCESFTIKS